MQQTGVHIGVKGAQTYACPTLLEDNNSLFDNTKNLFSSG